jgi:MFS superfamily sulfate permease-like transporter
MKAIKIITHPFILIISFLFILVSGQHWGGFYLLYLLLALPHGGIHAVLALAGIAILIFTYLRFLRSNKYLIEPVLNIIGSVCLVLSVFLFFYNDKQGYNNGTFEQLVPQITLALFGILTIAFIIRNLARSHSDKPVNGNLSLRKI